MVVANIQTSQTVYEICTGTVACISESTTQHYQGVKLWLLVRCCRGKVLMYRYTVFLLSPLLSYLYCINIFEGEKRRRGEEREERRGDKEREERRGEERKREARRGEEKRNTKIPYCIWDKRQEKL